MPSFLLDPDRRWTLQPRLDPDRYFDLKTPGAHEWWYFDAISADGRDVLVIIFYAGLPFDPSYGVAAIRHVRNPGKYPSPNPWTTRPSA